ncbi:MAG: hypothetical protein ISR83_04115 [Candidatus Marinimicrobia bacterium]|nr:hypothetical protein [Candidatus Neomarinimicrobiota bacterium]
MRQGESFAVAILLIICYKGFKRIGSWDGQQSRKTYYRLILPVLSFFMTYYIAVYMGYNRAWESPLFYLLLITILQHLAIKKPAQIWVKSGLFPFSKNYPSNKSKNWKEMFLFEKLLLTGTLLVLVSLEIDANYNLIIFQLRFLLFWSGILSFIIAIYLKYSNINILIGLLSIFLSFWVTIVNEELSTIFFGIGIGFLIWGWLQISKRRKAI